jgi:hypothetical protein
MPKIPLSYRVVEIPPARRDTHNYLDLYWWKHSIYALLEVDVTSARRFIDEYEAQTGEALSSTGYLAFCLGQAVDEDKSVQAYPKGRKHLVIFDDVDVFVPVERELGATRAAIPTSSAEPTTSRTWKSIARFARSRLGVAPSPWRGRCQRPRPSSLAFQFCEPLPHHAHYVGYLRIHPHLCGVMDARRRGRRGRQLLRSLLIGNSPGPGRRIRPLRVGAQLGLGEHFGRALRGQPVALGNALIS